MLLFSFSGIRFLLLFSLQPALCSCKNSLLNRECCTCVLIIRTLFTVLSGLATAMVYKK